MHLLSVKFTYRVAFSREREACVGLASISYTPVPQSAVSSKLALINAASINPVIRGFTRQGCRNLIIETGSEDRQGYRRFQTGNVLLLRTGSVGRYEAFVAQFLPQRGRDGV